MLFRSKIANGTVSNLDYQTLAGASTGGSISTQLSGKADTNLGNLAATTAINSTLLPASDYGVSLGSDSRRYFAAHLAQVALYNTTRSLTIQRPATGTSYVLTLPADQGSANSVLLNDGSGNLTWGAGTSSYSANWTSGDSISISHGLGSRDVMVQIYDGTTYEIIYVESIVMTSTSVVDLSEIGRAHV